MMQDGEKTREDMLDRAAYVYVTGQFPSHLRKHYTAVLRAITHYFRKPVAFDGRTGNIKLDDRVVEDLDLDKHPMVKEVRNKVAEGYFIQPSRGFGTRRPFWRVFMFKLQGEHMVDKITVQADGAVKKGWD
ncbi:hypothetical protein AQY21_20655 [Paracoccus sp. MKU1]|nr:hypothetical protein AQY21_20655 [Paracoccus sp. MKU1]